MLLTGQSTRPRRCSYARRPTPLPGGVTTVTDGRGFSREGTGGAWEQKGAPPGQARQAKKGDRKVWAHSGRMPRMGWGGAENAARLHSIAFDQRTSAKSDQDKFCVRKPRPHPAASLEGCSRHAACLNAKASPSFRGSAWLHLIAPCASPPLFGRFASLLAKAGRSEAACFEGGAFIDVP